MAHKSIQIKWKDNNSVRFDEVTHEIPLKHVFAEDAEEIVVGKMVQVKWGGRTWKGEVVTLPEAITKGSVRHK